MPIMIQEVTKKSGYPWAIRAVAFLQLGLALIANLTVKSRLPPKGVQKLALSNFTKHFKDRTYVLIIVGGKPPPVLSLETMSDRDPQLSSSSSACFSP